MMDEQQSVRSHRSSIQLSGTLPRFTVRLKGGNKRKLNFLSELDLIKLAVVNLPRASLIQAMPISMQVESTEVNRMRSHYAKMLQVIWKTYSKQVSSGLHCPLFGTFAKEGTGITPS